MAFFFIPADKARSFALSAMGLRCEPAFHDDLPAGGGNVHSCCAVVTHGHELVGSYSCRISGTTAYLSVSLRATEHQGGRAPSFVRAALVHCRMTVPAIVSHAAMAISPTNTAAAQVVEECGMAHDAMAVPDASMGACGLRVMRRRL